MVGIALGLDKRELGAKEAADADGMPKTEAGAEAADVPRGMLNWEELSDPGPPPKPAIKSTA